MEEKAKIILNNNVQKILMLIGTLTFIWFMWEQWDVHDFFYPEFWLDESKERAAILILIGCLLGIFIFQNNKSDQET